MEYETLVETDDRLGSTSSTTEKAGVANALEDDDLSELAPLSEDR